MGRTRERAVCSYVRVMWYGTKGIRRPSPSAALGSTQGGQARPSILAVQPAT